MSHFKGVFFDLHGTILLSDDVDHAWETWVHAFHDEMVERGAVVGFDDFKVYLGNLFESDAPEFDEPGFSLFMRRVKELGHRLGAEIPSVEIRPLVDRLVRLWHRGMYLDPETVEVLGRLRERYVVGLITNWEHTPRIFELVDELGMHGLFDSIVVSDDVGCAKPNPRIFSIALEKHGLIASEAVYVGDMDVDVQGALGAGLKPVLIKRLGSNGTWDPYSDKKDCDYDPSVVSVIRRLSELPELLDNL
ncbi:HAD family hydrolase [Candidatus Bathyarchaeota archaeon]|nr:MAG: HAD family hydrolase [Candidatus Bathyarchaeota archaeon]